MLLLEIGSEGQKATGVRRMQIIQAGPTAKVVK